jgi:hypothetical protein
VGNHATPFDAAGLEDGWWPSAAKLQNCKTAGFFSLNSQLAVNACECAGISDGWVRFCDSWVIKMHFCRNFMLEAGLNA